MTELIILTGRLGSGKTTILKQVAKELPKDKKIGILINEFAKVGIDGELIGCEVKEITSGCVCCTKGKDLVKQLNAMNTYDLIILETTGISKLYSLLEVIHKASVKLRSVITVVDTLVLRNARLGEETKRQIKDSSLVILSKADLVKEAAHMRDRLLKYNKNIVLSKGKVPTKMILDAPRAKIKRVKTRFVAGNHDIQAVSYKTNQHMSRKKFEHLLSKEYIERAKGYIKFKDQTVLFNYASGMIDYHPTQNKDTSMVFIGGLSWVDKVSLLVGLQRAENTFDIGKICKELMKAVKV